MKKQEQVNRKKKELQQVKAAKENLLREREGEKAKLEAQEKEKREMVASLQKKQKGLQSEINKKRREANQLNAKIDKLIAEDRACPQACRRRSSPGSSRPPESGCQRGQDLFNGKWHCSGKEKGGAFGTFHYE